MKKRIIAALTAISMILCIIPFSFAETGNGTKLYVNNELLPVSDANIIETNGIVLVPAKELVLSLGGNLVYDSTTMTETITCRETEISFRLDNNITKINGKNVIAPAAMQIINYKFMVPLEFTVSNLNAEIIFNRFKNAYLVFQKTEETLVYTVISGDTLWIISNVFGVSINQIKELNNFSTDSLNIGQKLILRNFSQTESIIKGFTSSNATLFSAMSLSSSAIGYLKAWTSIDIVGKNGDWYKVNTIKGTGYIYKTCIYIGQDIIDNQPNSTYFNNSIPVDSSLDFVTYSNYSIVRGDTLWNLSIKFGIPNYELMQINNFNESSILNIGQVIKYPIHTIPVKDSIAPQYGEVLDWFKEGQYVFPIGKVGKFIDVETGKSFYATRTTGANHADTEALTSNDATIMKQIFGGIWNWNKREFILEVDNRKIAVSVAGMPHAGVDGAPYLSNVANRSDDWGYGPNYDSISGNGMSGHFDVYTLNCLRHKDNKIDSVHQYNVLSAGGLK